MSMTDFRTAGARYFRWRDKGRYYSTGNERLAIEPNGRLWSHSKYTAPFWSGAAHTTIDALLGNADLEEFTPDDFVLSTRERR